LTGFLLAVKPLLAAHLLVKVLAVKPLLAAHLLAAHLLAAHLLAAHLAALLTAPSFATTFATLSQTPLRRRGLSLPLVTLLLVKFQAAPLTSQVTMKGREFSQSLGPPAPLAQIS